MIKEIGSEFWSSGPIKRDKIYLLSGRTALEFIIRDILSKYTVKSVLLPSYCCHTMIEPFIRHGLSVRFYDVYFDDTVGLSVDIPSARENEIFYYMSYFGFHQLSGIDVSRINKEFMVVIEDSTHSWLSGESKITADYSYASYRKWTGFEGIACANKKNGSFSVIPQAINKKYLDLRTQGFLKKKVYMDSGIGEKTEFLSLFGRAEDLLEEDYVGYEPSAETMSAFLRLDTEYIANSRKRNAKILIEGLKDINEIRLIFSDIADDETPLFVPVLLNENRTELKKHLINNSIYCPIHWPQSEFHRGISQRAEELYNQELSLVCDQRYDSEDMNRFIECIRKYYKR